MGLLSVLPVLIFTGFIASYCDASKPNIVFILADDLGWNDVSFHGSDQILTPNIDSLAYSGVAFGRYYSHAICTPSRAALLTGKYSYKTGMQGNPLGMSEDRSIPTNVRLLPQYFKDVGYSTHLVGKWHAGSSRREYLPTSRGFDTYIGHRGGYIDYYEYTVTEVWEDGPVSGLALFRNLTAAWDVEGYITDVYTEEAIKVIDDHDSSNPLFLMVTHNAPHAGGDTVVLQAPPEVVRELRYIESPDRRMYAAMVKKLDDSVGDIVKALQDKGILENTIIVFAADNGGMTTGLFANYASNYPLRGIKMSPYEGGVRVVGLLWSANLNNTNHYWDGYMHVTDWLPTLLSAAGVEPPTDIDGVDQWESINSNSASQRKTMIEIDDYTGYASITYGDYKMITGEPIQSHSEYLGGDLRGLIGSPPSYIDTIADSKVFGALYSIGRTFDMDFLSLRNKTIINCDASSTTSICYPSNDTVCLFNIIEDPCETTDLSSTYPELVTTMQALLDVEMSKRIPRIAPATIDRMSAPSLHNYTWDTWIN